MVLVGGLPTFGDLTWIVGEALAGGAGAIQLREKGLPDRELLMRAREVRIMTAQARALFVMNDRPDLARLAGADAVHLGQEDVSLRDARRVVGLGDADRRSRRTTERSWRRRCSTAPVTSASGRSSPARPRNSTTSPAWLTSARPAESSNLPWFAIGGITEANLDEVLDAGARRVAVSSAVIQAEFPRKATRALRTRLDSAG